MGDSSPKILLQTVYFIVGKHIAFRSRLEHKDLSIGGSSQIKARGKLTNEIIQYVERTSKNQRGGLIVHQNVLKTSEIHSTGGLNCPVRLIKLYLSKIHVGAEAFYCQPYPDFESGKNIERSCRRCRLGHNQIIKLSLVAVHRIRGIDGD